VIGPVWRAVPPSGPPAAGAPAEPTARYTLKRIQQMLGLSRYTIRQLIDGGFVSPARGPGNTWQFDFRDVVLLRVANDLRAARIPTRRIMRSLERLRTELPTSLPLTGLRIKAVGDQVAVHRRRETWDAESGQLLIDLDLGVEPGPGPRPAVMPLAGDASTSAPGRRAKTADPAPTAAESFEAGVAAEDQDPVAAERHYRRALELDPRHVDAMLNLSALLCESGRYRAAVAFLDRALPLAPAIGTLHFNRGVALEELGRAAEAIASYEAGLRAEPALADAHYNLARLHEIAGDHRRALRHLSSYRRLTRA
jgi:tetratricopeptide (TPR) repeat protein